MPRDPGSWFLLTDSARDAARLLPSGAPVLVAEVAALDESGLALAWADGSETRLAMPETPCLGFAALTGTREMADRVSAWWAETSGDALPVYRRGRPLSDGEGDAAFAGWMFTALARAAEGLNGANRALFAEAGALRRSYAGLQDAFVKLERYVAASGLSVPQLQYDSSPVERFWRPDADGATLTQVLPLLWPRFARVDLFLEPAAKATHGTLGVTLTLQPQNRVLKRWDISYDAVAFGALSFAPEAGIDLPSEVVATLTWSHADGAPGIGLSKPQSAESYVAVDARGLAMRVYSGLDGVASSAALTGERALDFDTLARARQVVFEGTVSAGYPSVHADATQQRLIVHPHGGVATIAVLPEAVPVGTNRVSALCSTFIDRASPLAYAMAAAPDGIPPESLFDAGRLAGDAFSGWHVIDPTQSRRLDMKLKRPAPDGVRLYLATRLPPGSTEDYNWAGWSDVLFGADGPKHEARPAPAVPPPPPPEAVTGPLPFTALARARRVTVPGEAARSFEPVWADAAERRLIALPEGEAATIVALADVLPAAARSVSAIAESAHREAGPVAYAMAALPEGTDPHAVFANGADAHDGFSGWRVLAAETPERIAVSAKAGDRVYLATSLPAGSNAAKAWASWSSVAIMPDAGDV